MATQSKTKSWNIKEAILEAIGKGQSVISGLHKQAAQAELEVSRKNWIINGDHSVNQRGNLPITGLTNGTYEVADRWKTYESGGNDASLVTVGLPNGAKTALNAIVTSTGGSDVLGFAQWIEDYSTLDSLTVTASAWVKSNNSNARLAFAGTGVTITSSAHTGSGNYEFLTVTKTLESSISSLGIYVAIASSTNLGGVSMAVGDYIEFTNVKLEIGSTATPFESRSYAEELALCQRYYQRILSDGSASYPVIRGYVNGADNLGINVSFPVTMRNTPTLVKLGTWNTTNCGQPSVVNGTIHGCEVFVTAIGAANVLCYPDSTDDGLEAISEL